MHRRGRRKPDRLADVPHRRRVAVRARILLDEVEDLLLALRQILADVHVLRHLLCFVERVFVQGTYPRGRTQPPGRFRGYTRRCPRADGGIGRRARLRAWSGITGWRFESSSAHRRKNLQAGGVSSSRYSLVPAPCERAETAVENGGPRCPS